ncbi:MAG: Type 1 glutamine amidotransferase-like domain-containing protein [bacterium]
MQNTKKKNTIYLSGGGDERQSFPLDKIFFETLPKNERFLYVPIALRGHKYYATAHLWMKGLIGLHKRDDLQFEKVDDPSKYRLDDLKLFKGIYIGGGNTWSLMQELKSSGFSEILLQYLETGGVVYGGSAGAIIFGKRIDTHTDENKVGYREVTGFNILGDYSIGCHFKEEQGEYYQEWAVKNKLPIICLPEETGLVIKNNVAVCVGTKPCVIYLADGSNRVVNPEDSFGV